MKNCASDVHVEVLCVDFLGVVKGIVTSSKVRGPFSNNIRVRVRSP